MTRIFVSGKPAAFRLGSSFEFCVENPSFSNAEGYTLNIEFPMKDSSENRAVFGFMCRDDVHKDSRLLPCVISSGKFRKSGALAITGVSESLVKGQFLVGVDPDNEELDIDKLRVNELDLGEYPHSKPSEISPEKARRGTGREVCLPWANISHNVVNCLAVSKTQWHEETTALAWQPYLLLILERIAAAVDFTIDLKPFKGSCWENAIICNTLPPTWRMPGYAAALPAWTVREFFSHLGIFLKGNFSFDDSEKTITFKYWEDVRDNLPVVTLHDVIDSYSCEVSRHEEDADYLPVKCYRYKSLDLPVWKYLDAPFVKRGNSNVSEFDSYEDYRESGSTTVGPGGHRSGAAPIIYLRNIDTFFCFRTVQIYSKGHVSENLAKLLPYARYSELQPVGVFSPPDYDSELEYEEMKVNPVAVDYAFEGKVMWLPVSSDCDSGQPLPDGESWAGNGITLQNGVRLSDKISTGKTRIESYMEAESRHESDSGSEEYFSELYIGIMHDDILRRPYPLTDVDVFGQKLVSTDRFMRLQTGGAGGVAIDPKVKYTFRFLADDIPPVDSMFSIHGQQYIAEKITATFSHRGMSQVLKGEFFRVL